MTGLRYTWSRVAPNVVEHLAAPDMYGQPLCGRELSNRTQTLGPRNESYPECRRCAAIRGRIESAAARFLAETDRFSISSRQRFPIEPTDANLRRVFRNVVKPIKPELYPLVRQVVETMRAEIAAQEAQ